MHTKYIYVIYVEEGSRSLILIYNTHPLLNKKLVEWVLCRVSGFRVSTLSVFEYVCGWIHYSLSAVARIVLIVAITPQQSILYINIERELRKWTNFQS